ncbi:MAG: sensor histidine kinase [Cyclobacteriaceae bacterium]
MTTKYASAERLNNDEILKQHSLLENYPNLIELFNAINCKACILNDQRQIVYANDNLLKMLEVDRLEEVLGIRPGEAIACKYAFTERGGCGTNHHCTVCGIVKAILKCQQTHTAAQEEARLTTHGIEEDKSLDIMAYVRPLILDGLFFMVLTLENISDKKRKESLERVFFHDLHNVAGSMNGLMMLVQKMPNKNEAKDMINLSLQLSNELLDDIKYFQHFTLAEKGMLDLLLSKFQVIRILQETINNIKFHKVAQNKIILLQEVKGAEIIESDRLILKQILINMLKNALEATPKDGVVNIGARLLEGGKSIRFYVNNQIEMPEQVKLQVFQRSFSTKGKNRGLGTYSIKLFTEKYLRGKASFISNAEIGTTFFIDIPVGWE